MDKTRELIGSTLFRKRKLKYKFEELLEILSATNTSYESLVLDENGRYSKKKTDALIDRLMECLMEVRAYRRIFTDHTGGEMRYKEFSRKEKSFYRSLFYLLLGLGMYTGENQWAGPGSEAGGTWDAICEISLSLYGYADMAELDRDLINASEELCFVGDARLRQPGGIFYRLLGAYEYVTGEYFTGILTEAEYRRGFELLSDTEKRLHDDPDYRNVLREQDRKRMKEIEHSMEEDSWSPAEEYSQTELEEIDEDMLMVMGDSDDEDRKVMWQIFFEDTGRLTSSCRTVHKGFFDPELRKNFDQEIRDTIEIFLSKNGYSAWLDDEKFFRVYTYMNKVFLASEKLMGGDGRG